MKQADAQCSNIITLKSCCFKLANSCLGPHPADAILALIWSHPIFNPILAPFSSPPTQEGNINSQVAKCSITVCSPASC